MARNINRGLGVVANVDAIVSLINGGTLRPSYPTPTYVSTMPGGQREIPLSSGACLDAATSGALAAAAGADLVQIPFAQLEAAAMVDKSSIPLCNYLRFPDGSLVNPAMLAYYTKAAMGANRGNVQAVIDDDAAQNAAYLGGPALPDAGAPQPVAAPTSVATVMPGEAQSSVARVSTAAAVGPVAPGSYQVPAPVSSVPVSVSAFPSVSSLGASLPVAVAEIQPAASTDTSSWFTESMVGSVPNWALLAVGVAALFLFGGGGGKR